jgi:DNA-binding LacI/PurR family transcriptional regulator
MPTNIKDIAKRAGVSIATVSYVINNSRTVSPDLKERVQLAIYENAANGDNRINHSR